MHIELKKSWEMEDTSQKGKKVVIKPGIHSVERVEYHNKPWLVITGTTVGMPESAVLQWQEPKWGDHQIIFKEE